MTRRIHFLSDVRERYDGWVCKRCGHVAASKQSMYEHRAGFLSRCFRARLKRKTQSLSTGTDRSGGQP